MNKNRNTTSAVYHAVCPDCQTFAYQTDNDTGETCPHCGKDLFDDSVELILIAPERSSKRNERNERNVTNVRKYNSC